MHNHIISQKVISYKNTIILIYLKYTVKKNIIICYNILFFVCKIDNLCGSDNIIF